jgi:hypothetical protein
MDEMAAHGGARGGRVTRTDCIEDPPMFANVDAPALPGHEQRLQVRVERLVPCRPEVADDRRQDGVPGRLGDPDVKQAVAFGTRLLSSPPALPGRTLPPRRSSWILFILMNNDFSFNHLVSELS